MHKLICNSQSYSWGKKGSNSLVGKILLKNSEQISENNPYAEYWMGTHISGPSLIRDEYDNNNLIKLEDYLKRYFGLEAGFPFLFKVLSIQDPLSIQVHPNKKFAEILNNKFPHIYKDPNHKPEMAIAISEKFELLYGFLSLDDSKYLCKFLCDNGIFKNIKGKNCDYDDLFKILFEETSEQDSLMIYKKILLELLNIDVQNTNKCLQNLFLFIEKYLDNNSINLFIREKLHLTKYLNEKFGNDKGILFALFMNYFRINSGEAVFIRPNIPHAYIYGDCMECMANSDNVIRLGLTPKYIDNENFEKIIQNNFDDLLTDNYKFEGLKKNDYTTEYLKENILDFKLNAFKIPKNQIDEFYNENFSILLVTRGSLTCKISQETTKIGTFEPYFIEPKIILNIYNDSSEDILEFFIASY